MVLKEQERGGREQLASLQKRLQSRYSRLRTLMQTGTPFLSIAETAKRQKAELIIMATHGRTGLSHLFLGSVAEKVVRTAVCPVLTIPARKAPRRKPARSKPAGKR
jgi:nucleotide-binding universal stress UspA family protein